MTTHRTFVISSRLTARVAVLLASMMVAMPWTLSGQQEKSTAPRVPRTAQADSTTFAKRQHFLQMFARAYFPGRTGQLLVVPREGDFITRPDMNVMYMHGSPWTYDVAIPLMFAGHAVKAGVYPMEVAQL